VVRVLQKVGFVHDGDVSDHDVGATWRFRLGRTRATATSD